MNEGSFRIHKIRQDSGWTSIGQIFSIGQMLWEFIQEFYYFFTDFKTFCLARSLLLTVVDDLDIITNTKPTQD